MYLTLPLFLSFVLFFNKKLVVLLLMEGLTVLIVFLFFIYFSCIYSSYSMMIIFSLFMVLESVFGLSLLIGVSRNSSAFNLNYSFL